MSYRNFSQHCRMMVAWVVMLVVAAGFGTFDCRAFTTFAPVSTQRTVSCKTSLPLPTMGLSLAASNSNPEETAETDGNDDNDDDEVVFENVVAAVVVPGFLTGSDEFEALCQTLTEQGIPTVAVPMPNWHWLPCLGGRSARPILERIDFTVQHLCANLESEDNPIRADPRNAVLNIPSYQYSWWDCWKDFRTNPGGVLQVGGAATVEEYPVVEPHGFFPPPPAPKGDQNTKKKKIALIGHSAGGWISRVYLSASQYGGKSYRGAERVHTLVTLGSPHSNALGPAFDGIRWINQPDRETDRLAKVRSLGVAGTGFRGDAWGELTLGAYGFCAPDDASDGAQFEGDGVTPIFSALGMPGAASLQVANVTHFCWSDVFGGSLVAPELTEDHQNGREWYGSPSVVKEWGAFLKEAANPATWSAVADAKVGTPREATLAPKNQTAV